MMIDEELEESVEYVTDGDTRIDEATVPPALALKKHPPPRTLQ